MLLLGDQSNSHIGLDILDCIDYVSTVFSTGVAKLSFWLRGRGIGGPNDCVGQHYQSLNMALALAVPLSSKLDGILPKGPW